MLVIGEVHTGLLQHYASVPTALALRILSLRRGEDVRSYERPAGYVVSPDLYTGLDCRVTAKGGPWVRGVGTARSYASISGGQIVQASTVAVLSAAESGRRLPWSYYLSRPGELELLGGPDWAAVATGWTTGDSGDAPDLGAISGRLLDLVQRSSQLRRPAPFRAARTRVRWALEPVAGPARIEFSLETAGVRTVRLTGAGLEPRAVADFCADLALHDWLLTTLLASIERSGLETGAGPAAIAGLRPVIDHLLHHWMPAARTEPAMLPYWHSLERVPGLDRQWGVQVGRIRDQMAIHTIEVLAGAPVAAGEIR